MFVHSMHASAAWRWRLIKSTDHEHFLQLSWQRRSIARMVFSSPRRPAAKSEQTSAGNAMKDHAIIADRLHGLRLLIIEDEPMLALCVRDIVESAGCIVAGVAGTVSEALAQVASCPFEVALLDLHLHGRTVELVVTAIKDCGKVAVISTGAGVHDVPAQIRLWPVLHKPYRNCELIDALARAASMSNIEQR